MSVSTSSTWAATRGWVIGWGGVDSHDFYLEPINNQPLLQGTWDGEMCVKLLNVLVS